MSTNISGSCQVAQRADVGARASWVSYGILVSFMLVMKLAIMGAGLDVDGFAMVFSWPWMLGVSAAGCLVFRFRPRWIHVHVGPRNQHSCSVPRSHSYRDFIRLTDDLPRPAIFLRRDLPTLPSRYSGFQLWCDFHRDSVPIVCSDYGGVVHLQHRASPWWPSGCLLDSGGPLSTARTHHSREWVQFTHGRLRLPVALW